MKKRLIGLLLLLVVSSQIFPVDGLVFWSNIMQAKDYPAMESMMTMEEEELDELAFKLKQIESSHSVFLESQIGQPVPAKHYSIIAHLGEVTDRNDPIFIPPPNTTI